MKDKPKCYLCGEVGSETEYWWHEKIKNICHSSCAVKCSLWVEVVGKTKEEIDEIYIKACINNNLVLLDHVKKNNTDQLKKFYQKVISKRGIELKFFEKVVKALVQINNE